MVKNEAFFAKSLISWYLNNKRDLPWRNETNPYFVWLSEIILQQTRVDQGLPYYMKFMDHFPTVFDLANASEEQVLKLWQGLGYYSRARNLHKTAKHIATDLEGIFPINYEGLIELAGIGDYTASAIASICYNQPTAVVDGNVYRVLSRVYGIDTPINTSQGIKEFKALAQSLIDKTQPGTFNQALMEFGARHCSPQNPGCDNCIFSDKCEALRLNKVKQLPVKIGKLKIKKRYFNYMVVVSSEMDTTILEQRKGKGIWQHLYEFPLIESTSEVDESELRKLPKYKELSSQIQVEEISLFNESSVQHKLSHQHLYTKFWIVKTESAQQKMIPVSELKNYPVPVLIENFISEFKVFQN